MYNYGVNWEQRIQELIPSFLRKKRFIAWVLLPILLIKKLHKEFILFRSNTIYNTRFTSQIIYLTKLLNDRFDYINKQIYILNTADITRQYVFNKAEQRTALVLYNAYNYGLLYTANQYCVYNGIIYKSLVNTQYDLPDASPTEWEYQHPISFLKNKSEFYSNTDFIIFIPSNLVVNVAELIALVNIYKLAGKRFGLQTY